MTSQTLLPTPALPDGVARLTHLGVIRIQGEDAAKFIHGQLTQDFSLLDAGEARLAAFCSAKGRMQASFIGFKTPDGDVLLVCSRDLLTTTLKRLSMFVMRAKAKLSDATEELALWGVAGSAVQNRGTGEPHPWVKHDSELETLVNLYPAVNTPRQLVIRGVQQAAPAGPPMDLSMWLWGEVMSGVATVSAPVVEAFVPQMLNYESIGGVSFKKGCYPGQEVVARSQFRGTLKRRAFVAHSDAPLLAAQEIYANGDPGEVVGQVVQSAVCPSGGFSAIVSLQLSAQDAPLSTGAGGLQLQTLPYPLLDDI